MITFKANQKIDMKILPVDSTGSVTAVGGSVEDGGIQVRAGNSLIAEILNVGGNVVSIQATGKQTGITRLTITGSNIPKVIKYIKVIPVEGDSHA